MIPQIVGAGAAAYKLYKLLSKTKGKKVAKEIISKRIKETKDFEKKVAGDKAAMNKREFDQGYKQAVRKESKTVTKFNPKTGKSVQQTDLPSQAAADRNMNIKRDLKREDFSGQVKSEAKKSIGDIKKGNAEKNRVRDAFVAVGKMKQNNMPADKAIEATKQMSEKAFKNFETGQKMDRLAKNAQKLLKKLKD